MKRTLSLSLTGAVALVLSGCLPEAFIWWSPDGKMAAVRTSEGLRLSSADGELSAVILPGDIQSASWSADGATLVISRSVRLTNWAAVEASIPTEEAAATLRLAQGIPDLLRAGLNVAGGSLNDISEQFLEPMGMDPEKLESAFFCALSLHRDAIHSVFDGTTNKAELQAEIVSSETNGLAVHEITALPIRNGLPVGERRVLVRSLRPLRNVMLSPRYPVLAFRAGDGELKGMALTGSNSVSVASENVRYAVWSANGRSLIFVAMAKGDRLGEIRSRKIIGESGTLLEALPQTETLAVSALITEESSLGVLPEGRVLFSSVPITLPVRTSSIHAAAQFFLLDPTRPELAPELVPLKEGSLPNDLASFVVSPDGKFVAVVEGGTDAVAILELSSGRAQIVSPAHEGYKCRMLPAWRNAQELTFAGLPTATARRAELVLWRAGNPPRVLSKSWPDIVMKSWLETPDEAKQQNAK